MRLEAVSGRNYSDDSIILENVDKTSTIDVNNISAEKAEISSALRDYFSKTTGSWLHHIKRIYIRLAPKQYIYRPGPNAYFVPASEASHNHEKALLACTANYLLGEGTFTHVKNNALASALEEIFLKLQLAETLHKNELLYGVD